MRVLYGEEHYLDGEIKKWQNDTLDYLGIQEKDINIKSIKRKGEKIEITNL